MSTFFRKLSWLTGRRRKEDELRDELQFHLDEEAEERQAQGLHRNEAQRAARRDLGNITLVQESTRSSWSWTFLEQLGQDLRYAMRAMVHNRTFTLLAVLSLALGIGANTAIYSFMDSILLRSLPVSDPASLAVLTWHSRARGGVPGNRPHHVFHGGSGSFEEDTEKGMSAGIFPYPAFEALRNTNIFSSLFAYYPTRRLNVMVKEQAELASGEYVSGDYFRGLAVPPAAGRLIASDDDRAGAQAVVVLSFAYSQKRYGGAVEASGQAIRLNNAPFTVIGVAPPEFFGVDPAAAPDLYVPVHANLLLEPKRGRRDSVAERYLDKHDYWLEMMGRLRPGVTLAQAQAASEQPFHHWVASTASDDQERSNLPALRLKPGAAGLDTLRDRYSKPLYVLLTMVALILAIACANIANLLLARATTRQREMAVRLSMGAGRFRVIRQLLTESLLLASLGGALGVLFAIWGIRFLTLLLANGAEKFTLHADLNWHVLGAAIALSLLTGLLFGLAPALRSTRVDVMPVLKETRTGERRPRIRYSFLRISLSHVLVVSQIGISLLMLVAAGLFVRTLSNLQSVQLGFNRENVLLFQVDARQAGHKDPEINSFYGDLLTKLSAIPGVRKVSLSNSPLVGEGSWFTPVAPTGKEPDPTVTDHILLTSAGFLTTMQIPLIAGREFDERDRPGSPPVVLVNQEYAKGYFGDKNPLGQHLTIKFPQPHEMEIVGVVKNMRYGDLKGDFPAVVFFPYNQGTYYPPEQVTYALRTTGDPLTYVKSVRDIVHQADPRVPVANVRTQAAKIDQTINQEIIFARLCTGFAILALLIACVGLYGTMSYNVARRTGEIGIRMALGAPRGRLLWMVLSEVFAMAAVGLAISVPIAMGASKLVESFLFGMKPNDPLALTIAVATLLAAALLAGYVPARQASQIDPMIALRHE